MYTRCGLVGNLECRSVMCCTRLAADTGRKNSPSGRHRTTLLCCIFASKACIDNQKKMLNSNTSSTCSHNMANFRPLTAEIESGVWGIPANVNGFRVLAALLHGSLVVGVSQTAALNRGRHLYSARRPSRWALTHIKVNLVFVSYGCMPVKAGHSLTV